MPVTLDRKVAAVDERRARLFRCSPAQRGRWHVEEVEALRSVWEEDHERHRPAILGRGPATMPPHDAGFGHEEEEEHRRFARDVAGWLEKHAQAPGSPMVVFAPPRFLGLLRALLPGPAHGRVKLLVGELSALSPAELGTHPAVVEALGGPAPNPIR